MVKALLINPTDNVAVALADIPAAAEVTILGGTENTQMKSLRSISFAHKIAIRAITKGDAILKYGVPIAVAITEIAAGEWVHVHNAKSYLEPAREIHKP